MSTTQNETRTIADTIQRSLRDAGYGSYFEYARPVIEALTAREQALCEAVIVAAAEAGVADDYDARALLKETGFDVKDSVSEESDDEDGSDTGAMGRIEQMLNDLTGQVHSLTEFARRNGYRSN